VKFHANKIAIIFLEILEIISKSQQKLLQRNSMIHSHRRGLHIKTDGRVCNAHGIFYPASYTEKWTTSEKENPQANQK